MPLLIQPKIYRLKRITGPQEASFFLFDVIVQSENFLQFTNGHTFLFRSYQRFTDTKELSFLVIRNMKQYTIFFSQQTNILERGYPNLPRKREHFPKSTMQLTKEQYTS